MFQAGRTLQSLLNHIAMNAGGLGNGDSGHYILDVVDALDLHSIEHKSFFLGLVAPDNFIAACKNTVSRLGKTKGNHTRLNSLSHRPHEMIISVKHCHVAYFLSRKDSFLSPAICGKISVTIQMIFGQIE